MTKYPCIIILLLLTITRQTVAQNTFKAVWKTYNTGMIIHEYTYNYIQADSAHLYIRDSAITFVSSDSTVTMTESFPYKSKSVYKTINYLNNKKQVLKTEEYKDDNLLEINEWRYNDKNQKSYHHKDNKINGNTYRKQFEYTSDKKTGESVTLETSYFNNRIEFYTRMYYNKKNVMYKEVRLNDNNKDIIHVETFTYGENGKVKSRSVYFPEFKVTKTFNEPLGNLPAKCFGLMPMGTMEKANLGNRIQYMKRVITKNLATILEPSCHDFEFTFTNNTNCSITVASTKVNNGKEVTYRLKERLK